MSKGKILLMGLGPGAGQHMSLRARQAVIEADVVIGYSTYIALVQDLLDGKQVIRKGMTKEVDRCVEAYAHARRGKTVALVSSGDIGVYGMAGPAYEVLFRWGWTPGSDIDVEVIPGSTALASCASLVGAPLGHDFCSISLSDLLTPWPVIARRLEAAARADFVVALYNPKSGRRTRQVVEAQGILLRYRKADTPVAIVKSAYREAQDVRMARLDEMQHCAMGMLTTVLIGNSSSYLRHGLMITPRGYANKYDDLTGAAKPGEKSGRSLSMGLEGWKVCVRKHLRDNAARSLREVAHHFDASVGGILAAIAEAGPQDEAGDFTAAAVLPGNEIAVLEAARQWKRMRAVVGSETGAVSELLLDEPAFSRRGDWLSIESPHFHLHIDGSRIHQAWFVRCGNRLRALYFVDTAGNTVFNLSLVREGVSFHKEAEQHFARAWQRFSTCSELEVASNE